MIVNFVADIVHLSPVKFWLITAIACSGAFLIRELSGRLLYGMIAGPLLWFGAMAGHLFLEMGGLHFGVDPITDAIMGAMFGMSLVVLAAIFVRQAVSLFEQR